MTGLEDMLREKEETLRSLLRASVLPGETLLVAYSGGVDSAYLAFVSHQTLGAGMKAVIADSPSLPRKELASAIAFAREQQMPLEILTTDELSSEAYVRNDALRCFHCKDELFSTMLRFASSAGRVKIAYGRNLDDDQDFRPGQQAAEQHKVLAPLADAGMRKADIRSLSRQAGLRLWDKPGAACLASRVEHGRPISAKELAQVEEAEDSLHQLGFTQVRVRHHGDVARIELDRNEMQRTFSFDVLDRITNEVRAAGYRYVALDTSGYRSGSMNAFVPIEAVAGTRK